VPLPRKGHPPHKDWQLQPGLLRRWDLTPAQAHRQRTDWRRLLAHQQRKGWPQRPAHPQHKDCLQHTDWPLAPGPQHMGYQPHMDCPQRTDLSLRPQREPAPERDWLWSRGRQRQRR
jgi:hypothetical protein